MWTIGKLAKQCGMNVETIRYYQRIGMLRVPPAQGSYRYYNQQDFERLTFIQNAKDAGLQLKEIEELLSLSLEDRAQVRTVIQQRLNKIDARIAELTQLKQRLNLWIGECEQSEADCPILTALQQQQRFAHLHASPLALDNAVDPSQYTTSSASQSSASCTEQPCKTTSI